MRVLGHWGPWDDTGAAQRGSVCAWQGVQSYLRIREFGARCRLRSKVSGESTTAFIQDLLSTEEVLVAVLGSVLEKVIELAQGRGRGGRNRGRELRRQTHTSQSTCTGGRPRGRRTGQRGLCGFKPRELPKCRSHG